MALRICSDQGDGYIFALLIQIDRLLFLGISRAIFVSLAKVHEHKKYPRKPTGRARTNRARCIASTYTGLSEGREHSFCPESWYHAQRRRKWKRNGRHVCFVWMSRFVSRRTAPAAGVACDVTHVVIANTTFNFTVLLKRVAKCTI